jgi:photosystem II stability/assembly factor-like uncharacterized protein
MDLLFTDEQNGVAIGSYGLYLVTSDGGGTWEAGVVDEENEYHLNAMVRFPDGVRLIAGEAGYSYRSLDDGASWEPLELPYDGSMWRDHYPGLRGWPGRVATFQSAMPARAGRH